VSGEVLLGKAILLLEDEPLIAFNLQEELIDVGASVTWVITCREALDLVDGQRFDCAVLDYQLRDGPCSEVAQACRDQQIPFIISTGSHGEATDDLGAIAVLRKPFRADDLVAAIASSLRCKSIGQA